MPEFDAVSTRELYSFKDLGHALGLSRASLYRLINAGHFDVRKVGRKTVVTAASVRAFTDSLPKAEIARPDRTASPAANERWEKLTPRPGANQGTGLDSVRVLAPNLAPIAATIKRGTPRHRKRFGNVFAKPFWNSRQIHRRKMRCGLGG